MGPTGSGGLTIDGAFGNAGTLEALGPGALTLNGEDLANDPGVYTGRHRRGGGRRVDRSREQCRGDLTGLCLDFCRGREEDHERRQGRSGDRQPYKQWDIQRRGQFNVDLQ
jgi:hypothetical protein